VGLTVEDETPFVDLTIEMDGELRHPGDGAIEAHQEVCCRHAG
jgi:hypothetical protein